MIKLSDHFNAGRLIRFAFPSVIMLVFTSIYSVIDGFFVSNFVGKAAFTAINFIWPFISMLSVVGFMFGAGGSALIAKTYGEGNKKKANEIFSFVTYFSAGCGVVLGIAGIFFLRPVAIMFGASGEMLEQSIIYGVISLLALPFYMLQCHFQYLFPAAEKPKLGLYITVAAGVSNAVFDALFIVVFKWGIAGAAIATAVSEIVGGLIPIIYFAHKNTSILRLGRTSFHWKSLGKVCANGSSEFMSNLAMSVIGMFYNAQLMKYAGENGVAAFGVIMYASFVVNSVFMGFTTGTAPIVSYNYGAGNKEEVRNLLRLNLVIIGFASVISFVLANLMAHPLSMIFVGYDQELYDMTVNAMSIYALSFLFSGFAIFGSGFFTALNDGIVSAIIAFLRTFVFESTAIMIFPLIWGLDGIWLAVTGAEVMAVIVTVFFLVLNNKKYGYWKTSGGKRNAVAA